MVPSFPQLRQQKSLEKWSPDIVGTAHCRIQVDALTDERSKHWNWKNTGSIELNLSDKHKTDISRGADHILAQTQIKASDWHYDAKIWPHMHPYGTGSAFSEVGSGALSRLVRNRLLLIQNCFRNNSLYAFWFLHRLITKELFFRELRRKKSGDKKASCPNDPDPITRLYGTVMPKDIPESCAWRQP